ncbi:hypothetical protein ABPG75_007329 [Micractinium tetrahymenae]
MHVRSLAILARVMLLTLLPSLAHTWLILCSFHRYRRHRALWSLVLRAPWDAWLVFTQDVPVLGIGGAVIRRGLPHSIKLLLVVFFQFILSPLLASQPFAFSYPYSTALLALWLLCHMRSACWAMLLTLLTAYAAPLVSLYRREVEERTTFVAHRLRQGSGLGGGEEEREAAVAARLRRMRAWVDSDPFAPADLLVPAALGALSACLRF